MDIKTIAPDLSVSPQLSVQDVGIAASQGFRSLIINRPDGESSDQTAHAEIEAAARRHGLEVRYVPVVSGKVTDADVEAFDKAMHELAAPALAYCRTGTRSATLWALSQAGHLSTDAILKTTASAGYDLAGLRARLEARDKNAEDGIGPVKSHDVVIIGGGGRRYFDRRFDSEATRKC